MTVAAGFLASTGTVRSDPAVTFAFSGSGDGNMSLIIGAGNDGARPRLATALGVRPEALVFMRQVHGGDVAVVSAADRGRGAGAHADAVPAVDALVTFDTDVPLVVLVADCVPVVLVDPHRAVGVVHAGRGGVVNEVVAATVAAMAPAAPEAMTALIGPAIGGCCYEVEAELADHVAAGIPAARATTSWGTPSLDLRAAVAAQLRASGVADVRREGGCTRCDGRRWFSHRRAPGEGRQAGAVVRAGTVAGRPGGTRP